MSKLLSTKPLKFTHEEFHQPTITQGRFAPFLPVDVHPAVYTLKQQRPHDDNLHREGLFLHEPLPVSEPTVEAMIVMGDSRHE